MPWGWGSHRVKASKGFGGGSKASTNWRYLTDADQAGPRKEETMMSTTFGKKQFQLTTADVAGIQGYRHPKGGRTTLTMYYTKDLAAAAVKKYGQAHFDSKIPEGRKMSGVEAKEQAAKAERVRVAVQQQEDRGTFAVVPAERLANHYPDRLRAMVIHYEGALTKGDHQATKVSLVARSVAAGYTVEAEQVRIDALKEAADAAAAKEAASLAAMRAQEAARQVKRAAAALKTKAESEQRMQSFDEGMLGVDALHACDLQKLLKRRGLGAGGSKAVLLERLQGAIAVSTASESASKSTAKRPAAEVEGEDESNAAGVGEAGTAKKCKTGVDM